MKSQVITIDICNEYASPDTTIVLLACYLLDTKTVHIVNILSAQIKDLELVNMYKDFAFMSSKTGSSKLFRPTEIARKPGTI